MKTFFSFNQTPPLLYNMAQTFLNGQTQGSIAGNQHHISAITQAALQQLKSAGYHQKLIKNLEAEVFSKAIKDVVISAKTPWTPSLKLEQLTVFQNLMYKTLRGDSPTPKELFKQKTILKNVVWKRNPALLKESRELIQQLLNDLFLQLSQKNLSAQDTFHLETIIGEFLSLYPFLNPEQGECLTIPSWLNDKWELIKYHVDRIQLTPDWMGSPLMSFGLTPESLEAPPLLLFKGTTYPTDDGFGLSLLTDFNPFSGVGTYGFKLGKKKISKWLHAKATTSKAIIYGKSLGGALACLTTLSFPEFVQKTITFGTPGLCARDLQHCHQLVKDKKLPPMHLFCQQNDTIPAIDHMAKSGIHYYQTLGKTVRHGIIAHADMYCTHEISSIVKLDPKYESKRWIHFGLTFMQKFASVTLFPLLLSIFAMKRLTVLTIKLIRDTKVLKTQIPQDILKTISN